MKNLTEETKLAFEIMQNKNISSPLAVKIFGGEGKLVESDFQKQLTETNNEVTKAMKSNLTENWFGMHNYSGKPNKAEEPKKDEKKEKEEKKDSENTKIEMIKRRGKRTADLKKDLNKIHNLPKEKIESLINLMLDKSLILAETTNIEARKVAYFLSERFIPTLETLVEAKEDEEMEPKEKGEKEEKELSPEEAKKVLEKVQKGLETLLSKVTDEEIQKDIQKYIDTVEDILEPEEDEEGEESEPKEIEEDQNQDIRKKLEQAVGEKALRQWLAFELNAMKVKKEEPKEIEEDSKSQNLIGEMKSLIKKITPIIKELDKNSKDDDDYFPARDLEEIVDAIKKYISRNI